MTFPLAAHLPRVVAGHTLALDVTLHVALARHRPGVPASRHDCGTAPEHRFTLVAVEWAEGHVPDECGPDVISPAEQDVLRAWLRSPAGHRAACEAVADAWGDYEGGRAAA